MNPDDLARRLQALEALDAIRALKSRYLACCDAKDPVGMRACFMDGPVHIDFGAVGVFDRADALVEVFKTIGCHEHMVEMHHGVNPQIELLAPDRANGHWGLHYQLINTRENTLTQLGARYEDVYQRTADGWRIASTRCIVTSLLVLQLGTDSVKTVLAGRSPPAGAAAPPT